jgi:hypothetical protein
MPRPDFHLAFEGLPAAPAVPSAPVARQPGQEPGEIGPAGPGAESHRGARGYPVRADFHIRRANAAISAGTGRRVDDSFAAVARTRPERFRHGRHRPGQAEGALTEFVGCAQGLTEKPGLYGALYLR